MTVLTLIVTLLAAPAHASDPCLLDEAAIMEVVDGYIIGCGAQSHWEVEEYVQAPSPTVEAEQVVVVTSPAGDKSVAVWVDDPCSIYTPPYFQYHADIIETSPYAGGCAIETHHDPDHEVPAWLR